MIEHDPEHVIAQLSAVVFSAKNVVAVWQRGGAGKRAISHQRKAIAQLFAAITGRAPTDAELERMGANTISVG